MVAIEAAPIPRLPDGGDADHPSFAFLKDAHKDFVKTLGVSFTKNVDELFEANASATQLVRGHKIFDDLRAKLDSIDTDTYYRSKHQRRFQEEFISSLATKIYGIDCLRTYEVEICKYNGFQSLGAEMFLTMPRRSGKTESVCQLIACLLVCVPAIKIIAVSPSFRASGGDSGLIKQVETILISRLHFHKAEKNEEKITYTHIKAVDERVFQSCPAGVPEK
jgi:hypothetical protein